LTSVEPPTFENVRFTTKEHLKFYKNEGLAWFERFCLEFVIIYSVTDLGFVAWGTPKISKGHKIDKFSELIVIR